MESPVAVGFKGPHNPARSIVLWENLKERAAVLGITVVSDGDALTVKRGDRNIFIGWTLGDISAFMDGYLLGKEKVDGRHP